MNARARWQALSPRERRSLALLASVLGAALFWLVAIAPALNTLRDSTQRRMQLAQQQSHMLALQAQAQTLTTRSPLSRDAALRSLQGLTPGPQIQLTPQGDRVTAQLKAVPAATLASWLAQARTQAQVLPVEAHLTRGNASDKVVWDGALVLSLPRSDSPSAATK
jgi:general secretion pathway protein M